MALPLVLTGLVQAAQKRRLLGRAPAQRLADYAVSKGVGDMAGLRTWLASGDGLSPDLAKKLLGLLPPPNGSRFGPYSALAHLADGGMGSVWMAAKDGADELVVVKTMKAGMTADLESSKGSELVRRFERETAITRQLDHPNVVRCLDAGVADSSTMYMVLEYVDSGDLRDLVDAKSGLSEGLALAILYQVVDGLAEAHRLKLVHRDIKPPNIFVSSEGRAKLADFGIARSTEANRTMLTMEGAIVGSPQYMSPEQIVTDPTLDTRSDLYALGCVLYFCLAAEPPYGGKLQEILHQHCTAPVPDLRKKRAKVSDGVLAVLAKSMAKDRAKRYQDPAEMREGILAAMQGLGLQPGAMKDETTAVRDLSGRMGTGVHRDIATLTADLRRQDGLDDIATIVDPHFMAGAATATAGRVERAEQATITANLSADLPTMATDLSGGANADMPTITADLSGGQASDPAAVTVGSGAHPAVSPMDVTVPMGHTPASTPAAITVDPRPSADLPTIAANLNDVASMTAMLLKEEMTGAPTPAPGTREPGTSATVHEEMGTIARILAGKEPASAPATEPLAGDAATALAEPWIALVPADPATDAAAVILYAKPKLLLGKLKEAPVDLCLRNYPVAVHKDACQRISRSHLVVRYDPVLNRCQVEDQNAANGTLLDGITVAGGASAALAVGVDNIVDLAGVVTLWVRCLPRQGARSPGVTGLPGPAGDCGIDTDAGYDAITMTRPENRPEMAYAMVLRRLSIGGPGADLALAGARTRAAVEVARAGGRWIWRPVAAPGTAPGPWQPLAEGTTLDCGGRRLSVRKGDHSLF